MGSSGLKRLHLLGLGVMLLAWSGCFRRYFLSDKDIARYYETHSPAPVYQSYDTLGHRIFYASVNEDRSDLPLLILVHGSPGGWWVYLNLLTDPRLLEHFRMISVDRPGFGKSDLQKRRVNLEETTNLLLPLVRKSGGAGCYLLGRSYGGPVVAQMAAQQPERVKGLMLLSSASSPELEKFWWFSKPADRPPIRWLLGKPVRRASDEKFAHVEELKLMLPIWAKITAPTVVMHGGNDWIVDTANGAFMDRALTHAPHRLIRLPGVGHRISNEAPDRVVEELINLLH